MPNHHRKSGVADPEPSHTKIGLECYAMNSSNPWSLQNLIDFELNLSAMLIFLGLGIYKTSLQSRENRNISGKVIHYHKR